MPHFSVFTLKPAFLSACLFFTLLVALYLPSPWLMAKEGNFKIQLREPSKELLMDEQRQRAIPMAISQPGLPMRCWLQMRRLSQQSSP